MTISWQDRTTKPCCENISGDDIFSALRYEEGGFCNKAGILPFQKDKGTGEVKFLLAAPKAQRNEDDIVPFAIARGTRRQRKGEGKGAAEEWQDIRGKKDIEEAERRVREGEESKIEPLWKTAIQEAKEELGLEPKNIRKLYDCGVLQYKDYGINFFLAELEEQQHIADSTRDSRAVRWLSEQDVKRMSSEGTRAEDKFNTKYLKLFEAMCRKANEIASQQHSQQRGVNL